MKILKLAGLIMIASALVQPVSAMENVTYTGEAYKHFEATDNFFSGVQNILPGDNVQDTVAVENTSDKDVEMFFKTDRLSQSEYLLKEDYQLLDEIDIEISYQDDSSSKLIYKGKLGDSLDFVSLGRLPSKEAGELKFILHVPDELDNQYDMTQTDVLWTFGALEDGQKTEALDHVKTGDQTELVPIALLSISGAYLAYQLIKRKENAE